MIKRVLSICIAAVLLLPACGSEEKITAAQAEEEQKAEPEDLITEDEEAENKHTYESAPEDTGDVVEIKEKLFIAQTNDIYINSEFYLGKTIKYEGLFDSYYWEEADATYYYVIRYGPGCCGDDDNAGFEIVWDGEYPKDNEWVEVVGELETYEEDGNELLRLNVSSLKILEERGAEYVES